MIKDESGFFLHASDDGAGEWHISVRNRLQHTCIIFQHYMAVQELVVLCRNIYLPAVANIKLPQMRHIQ